MQSSLNFLDKLEIPYELLEHKAVYTVEEAMAELPGRTEIKNLFIQDDKGKRQYLVIMPGLKKLDLKQLAVDLGEKKVRFCSPEKVESMLGVKPGSVSIFCCLNPNSHHVSVIFDEELLDEPDLGFHPIVNTATVFIPTKAIHAILEALPQQSRITKL
ncbi:MAG TPA: YbaK/EbsC family protein [Candidatus Saccharibacteria bacterium]|jgi:Ala-tRNA(Pro) deacylase|nr:YbaK/EbsC family protein [Candidatus Saccharibacteria bacterium]HMT55680.1 YbaK/EbsC family protein [Candidatus Saccharibacteria bacterium]